MTLDPTDLERRVDRALKALPPPAAPPALFSRVMRGVEAGAAAPAAPLEWPVSLKVALTAMSALLIVAALLAWPLAMEFARASWQSPAAVVLRATVDAARTYLPAVLLYVTAMIAASAAAASMLKHVALGGASQS